MNNYCPECGNIDFREPYNDGHKQCNDRDCLQEFFDDVDYSNSVPQVLRSKHEKIKTLIKNISILQNEVKKTRHTAVRLIRTMRDKYYKQLVNNKRLQEEIDKRDALIKRMIYELNKIEKFSEGKASESLISGYGLISAIVKNFKINSPFYKNFEELSGVRDE